MECTRTGSRLGRGGLPFDEGRVAPETLQTEVFANGRLEDMHHDVPVVEQYPFRFVAPFDPQWSPLDITELELDLVGQALHVTVGGTGRDREHVGDPQELRDIQEDDIGGFLGIECFRDQLGDLSTVNPVLDERSRLLCGNVLSNNDSDIDHAAGMTNLDQHLSPTQHRSSV